MKIELRNYQIEISNKATDILNSSGWCYLNLATRTGKSFTSLQTAENIGAKTVLFLTKKKAITSVLNDYNLLQPNYTIQVTNYEQATKISGHFDLLILDEAQNCGAFPKPPKRYKDILALNYDRILFLSATPTPESWSQIYHQLQLAKQFSPFKQYKTFYKWANDYVNVKQIMIAGNKINDYSNALIDKIEKIIEPNFIRFTQQEAGFTQTVQEQIHFVEMKPIIYTICEKLKKDFVFVGKTQTILADTPVKLLSKLHQLYSGTIKFEDENSVTVDNSKALFIKDKFEGKKIAIFYKFKQEFEMLKEVFNNRWTDDSDIFNKSNYLVYLGQFVSSREGINLSTADDLIFINIDFSALSYLQAKDRLSTKDRIKENRLHWIFAFNGIEREIHKTVMKKEDFTLRHFKKLC
jgi:superfamily II DNA or RNA helicase